MEIGEAARGLALYACEEGLIEEADLIWAYNRILEIAGQVGPSPFWESDDENFSLDEALGCLVNASIEAGVCEDIPSARDRLAMRICAELTPRPSEVAAVFDALYADLGPQAATDYLYHISCASGYVRTSAIAKNVCWNYESDFGTLEITINCSKPEKDPIDIARGGMTKETAELYPSCQLCIENEGYGGRTGALEHPARQNLRIVPIQLNAERWGLQYSPYAYYEEHCIAMSAQHRPMHIDKAAFDALFDFCDLFPHYFIGSNADLPIVGGSILSHDHFQGGAHVFPMMRAPLVQNFTMKEFPSVTAGVLKWPLSVIRLSGESREELIEAACHILDIWRNWDDASLGILSHTEEIPHNTLTPILYRDNNRYVLDIALRCNITSEEHPLGVFHPHKDKWYVKKENIGLIEVMGMAILPPRLIDELDAGRLSQNEIGSVFSRVLEDCGVFSWDPVGREGFKRFLAAL